MTPRGYSPLAIIANKQWDGPDRPKGWQNQEFGLIVHTSGRGLPSKAKKLGQYPTRAAIDHYSKSHGCHYIIGYRGIAGGDLIQISRESELAYGVGVGEPRDKSYKGQRESVRGEYSGSWDGDIPPALVKRWRERWPGYKHPLDLLPGTRTANSPYIHVEMIPIIPGMDAIPAFEGSLFTPEQHETVAELANCIAQRKGWNGPWWRTPRLLGHSDITPITRHDKRGGWDPGSLREKPYFSWELVIDKLREFHHEISSDDYRKLPKDMI